MTTNEGGSMSEINPMAVEAACILVESDLERAGFEIVDGGELPAAKFTHEDFDFGRSQGWNGWQLLAWVHGGRGKGDPFTIVGDDGVVYTSPQVRR